MDFIIFPQYNLIKQNLFYSKKTGCFFNEPVYPGA